LREGAQPSDRVKKLLEVSGAWDDFTSGKTPEVIAAAAAKAAEAAEAESAPA
jgi:ribosomal protein S16